MSCRHSRPRVVWRKVFYLVNYRGPYNDMTPILSIIIVSWNVRALLEKCLASLAQDLTPAPSSKEREVSTEVIVVDNASTDGTTEWLRSLQLTTYNLQLTTNTTNRGFAAANNQGMRATMGEYVLLLNPDTELRPHALDTMVIFMQSHPRCGIVGPKLLNRDGTVQPSVRRFPDAWGPILLSLGMAPQRYLATNFDYKKAQTVDQVMGACFLIRRALIEDIGLLDEKFFIWFEEVDYCKRAKSAGWEVWYTPDASIVHHGGKSFSQQRTLQKQWWYSKSLLYYFWKHRQWGAWFLNALTVPLRLLLRAWK